MAKIMGVMENKSMVPINGTAAVRLPVAGWTGSGPYVQTVAVNGVRGDYLPIPLLDVSGAANLVAEKVLRKQAGWVSYYDTADGRVTFTCRFQKPTVDLTFQLTGVNA